MMRHRDKGQRYKMREALLSIGDDYWIENDSGERAFKVDGKALRLHSTFVLENSSGDALFKIQKRGLSIRDTMKVVRDGETVATVKKALLNPLGDRFEISLEDGGKLSAKGHFAEHDFKIERDGDRVAEISRRWFAVRDTYGIEVAPGQDDALVLALTVCIDELARLR